MSPSDIGKAWVVFLHVSVCSKPVSVDFYEVLVRKLLIPKGKERKGIKGKCLSVLLLHGPPEKQPLVTLVAAASCA